MPGAITPLTMWIIFKQTDVINDLSVMTTSVNSVSGSVEGK